MRRVIVALAMMLAPSLASATPMYAAQAAKACDTCHIEPTGWKNPELKLRKCTLDCSGCHTSSTGGGMRKPSGEYYGRQDLPAFGKRPGADTDPEKYRGDGDQSAPGRFRIWEGFQGWVEGTHPMEEIKDRFGRIDPDPRWDVGGDFRFMGYYPKEGDSAVFPMQTDVYAMVRPAKKLKVYGTAGYLGRLTREPENMVIKFKLRPPTAEDIAEANEDCPADDPDCKQVETVKTLVAMRELFLLTEGHPYGAYLRAGRFNKPHGWRIPDHTSFVRRNEGFDQNSQVFGVEAGFSANYPYGNLALFYQGSDDWPGDLMQKGYGLAFTGGYRGLAGQAGLSVEYLQLENAGTRTIVGPIWAINAYPVVWLAEIDFVTETPADPAFDTVTKAFAFHQLQFEVGWGVRPFVKYDWLDGNVQLKDDHQDRYSVGVELNPFRHVQFHAEYRWAYLAGEPSTEDFLAMTHFWF